jgi:hypothetical protein
MTDPLLATARIAFPGPQALPMRNWTCSASTAVAPMPPVVGRGVPLVAGAVVRTKLPLRPALSCHVPFNVASVTRADTCNGVPAGAPTTDQPKPTVPSKFMKAVPMTELFAVAPH